MTGTLVSGRQPLEIDPTIDPLLEVPTDQSPLPPDWLGLLCWNIQVGGTSTSPTAMRPPMVAGSLERAFGGTYQIVAAQEISGTGNADVLADLLPGGSDVWDYSFFDTTDIQDNGFWFRAPVMLSSSEPQTEP